MVLDALNVTHLSTTQIAGLTVDAFSSLTTSQIKSLSAAQIGKLTTDELERLSRRSFKTSPYRKSRGSLQRSCRPCRIHSPV